MGGTRRPKGTGGAYQRSRDGRWVAVVELPPKADGKRGRKEFTGSTKTEAEKKAVAFRREMARHGFNPQAAVKVSDWLDQWLQATTRSGALAPRTIDGYAGYIEAHIKPSVGRYQLAKLTPAHVDRMTTWITNDKGLSPTTALQALNILKAALKDAVRRGLIDRNVATLVRPPSKAHYEGRSLAPDEARTLLAWAWGQDSNTAARIGLALLTGMRQSEALGLTREHVNLGAGTIRIEWQLQRLKTPPPRSRRFRHVGGAYYLTQPKSRSGVRVVPIIELLRLILERRLAEIPDRPDAFIVTAPEGGHLDASRDSKEWAAALKAAGVTRVRLHDARHTAATLMREGGVAQETITSIMGHSTALMTQHYQHVALESRRNEVEAGLGGQFDGVLGDSEKSSS